MSSAQAFGHAHPYHEHEDILGEEDLLIGFKAGPQITSYTQYTLGNANIVPQSRMRAMFGGAMKFVWDLPRLEIGGMWDVRGWVNTENSVNSIAFPVVLKFPLTIQKGIELELGPGVQPEVTLGGADPHRNTMFGVLGSAGLSIDYKQYVIDFDFRYDVGVGTVADAYDGTKTRDLQMLAGVLWHF